MAVPAASYMDYLATMPAATLEPEYTAKTQPAELVVRLGAIGPALALESGETEGPLETSACLPARTTLWLHAQTTTQATTTRWWRTTTTPQVIPFMPTTQVAKVAPSTPTAVSTVPVRRTPLFPSMAVSGRLRFRLSSLQKTGSRISALLICLMAPPLYGSNQSSLKP